MIRIALTSLLVDDQAKAVAFYTGVLGFVKKVDIPVGEFRWLTVVAPGADAFELVLEPNVNPAAKTFQKALFDQGIPATSFETDDLDREYARMTALGVVFRSKPAKAGPVSTAIFEDTCGNLIQLHQHG